MNPMTWAITLREAGRDAFDPQPSAFLPDADCDHAILHRWLKALGLPANAGLVAKSVASQQPLTRAEAARLLYVVLEARVAEAAPSQ